MIVGKNARRLVFLTTVYCLLSAVPIIFACSERSEAAEDKPAPDEREKLIGQTQQILELINKLESQNEAEQKAAFQSLKEIGPPAIPFLIDKMKGKSIYLELVSQIQSFRPPTAEEIKANLQIWQEMIGTTSDKEIAVIEKYLYSKYLNAVQSYQKEDYQGALDTINAIVKLEPRFSFTDKLKLFRLACEEKIIQKNILRATLRTPKEIHEIGDKIFVTLKLENVALNPLEVTMPNEPLMIIYITAMEYGPLGDYLSISRMEGEKLPPNNISLKPQEFWEHTFTIDTTKENPKSIYYRVYEITAEIRPSNIKSGKEESIRKIISLPLTIRAFPPNVDKVLKAPIPSLSKALDGGIPIDIFLCSLLVPEADKETTLELLMRSLEKSSSQEAKKAIMTSLKHITRLPVEIDEKAWKQWWKDRKHNR